MEKINLYNNTIDLDYMRTLVKFGKRFPDRQSDIWDSVSANQFVSKKELLTTILESGILTEKLTVIVIGSWYGSIIVPVIAPLVKKVVLFDIDEQTTHMASNLHDYDNCVYSTVDVTKYKSGEFDTDDLLIINTSCEHMESMCDVLALQKCPWNHKRTHFAFQSNNMYGIEGHVNCKDTIDDFKKELPPRHLVLKQQGITEERGTRYFLFGMLPPRIRLRSDGSRQLNLRQRTEQGVKRK